MDYISSKNSKTLTNEPYLLSTSELRRMIRLNHLDYEETRHVTESSQRGETYYYNDGHPRNEKIKDNMAAFFKEVIYRDMKTDGFVMKYPHGTVIRQGTRNSYYRGENQIYDSTQPTLYRSLEKITGDEEKKLYRFVADMRIAEFQIFLNKLDIVQLWQKSHITVLYEPLAQHYGLETKWLDITSDLDVALFFATCKYDVSIRQWRPLSKQDTEVSEKTQYGVIFHIPGWQAQTTFLTSGLMDGIVSNMILPIGYQPFMRCHSQHGYGICMDAPFPLQKDDSFEKLWFRHDENLSREIYEKMECGRKIYPQDGLGNFEDIIEKIKKTTVFSSEAYKIALEKNTNMTDTEVQLLFKTCDCLRLFGSQIIITDEDPIKVSRQRIRACNRKYEGFSIEKNYNIKLFSRMVYTPPSNKDEGR